MAEFDLATIMDAIAAKLLSDGIVTTAYAYPAPQFVVPCAVVGWPTKVDFDLTFKRGADTITFPIWFVVSDVSDLAARNALSVVISGAVGIKDSLDGPIVTGSSGRVIDCVVEVLILPNGLEYLAAKFVYEVIR